MRAVVGIVVNGLASDASPPDDCMDGPGLSFMFRPQLTRQWRCQAMALMSWAYHVQRQTPAHQAKALMSWVYHFLRSLGLQLTKRGR
mmetsp:Transcript_6330/g.14290  ORF Transcript_6330/g.14290 Transcript_6330/m.14290 type:complete len:87 (+) Transcript_6330:211-471(+)